jgi:hypothetical protein
MLQGGVMRFGHIVAWLCIIAFAANAIYMLRVNAVRAEEKTQRVSTFYQEHNCRPEGYVATRNEPVRTYRCDNGLFIAEDMK